MNIKEKILDKKENNYSSNNAFLNIIKMRSRSEEYKKKMKERSIFSENPKVEAQTKGIRDKIAQILPDVEKALKNYSGDSGVQPAFTQIIECLEGWPLTATYLKKPFLQALIQLVNGDRSHFQYVVTPSGEFLIGNTHESISASMKAKISTFAGNISLKGITNGKICFYVDQGSSAAGKSMGSSAQPPVELTNKMNRYIPPELRCMIEFIPIAGTGAIRVIHR